MARKFWQTKKFKQLEQEWYRRLEEEKFSDLEKWVGGTLTLRQEASNCYRQAPAVVWENKQRYFELLGVYFHQEKEFKDEVEAFVMEQRANGVSIKRISKELETMGERCHRQTIRTIVRKYEVKWGIKNS